MPIVRRKARTKNAKKDVCLSDTAGQNLECIIRHKNKNTMKQEVLSTWVEQRPCCFQHERDALLQEKPHHESTYEEAVSVMS